MEPEPIVTQAGGPPAPAERLQEPVVEPDDDTPDPSEIHADEDFESTEIGPELTQKRASNALERMLSSQPKPLDHERFKIGRLSPKDENPGEITENSFVVTLRGLDERELEESARRSLRPSTVQERRDGAGARIRDTHKGNVLTVASGMLDPDLSGQTPESQALLQQYGGTPEQVIRSWFAPGEIQQMADVVLELSGWSDEALVRAKN